MDRAFLSGLGEQIESEIKVSGTKKLYAAGFISETFQRHARARKPSERKRQEIKTDHGSNSRLY
jgi:hypothetical protein